MKTIEELVAEIAKNSGVREKTANAASKPAAPRERINLTKSVPEAKPRQAAEERTYGKLNLELAKKAALAAETAARIMGVSIVAAVCDEGANLVLLHAMDDSYIASVRAAQDKAYTSVALKMPTHEALRESRGGALDGLTNGNGILLLGGGIPLKSGNKIYGGIGVSGGTKEQDTLIAAVAAEILRIQS